MEENMKDGNNKNLIAILIALIVLIVVAVIYWDRQKQRAFRLTQVEMQGDILEEWGPQVQPALGPQVVAFSKQVSYKNIISRITPSVVTVNVESGLVSRGGLAQNVWGGRMGGWGLGPGGFLACPNCGTRVPHQRGVPAYTVNCPSCGTQMMREGAPRAGPVPGQAQQLAAQNQPADQSREATGFGQYVWGGRMGGWGLGPGGFLACPNCGTKVPHQRGVPAYTANCPTCGTQMMREGAPWAYPIPQPQQVAQAQQGRQFQALGRGGSGVIVHSRGYVLTNHHVVHGARSINVTLSSGQITKTYPAQLVDEAPYLDFAILKILAKENEQFTPALIGNSSEVSVGDEVLAVGSPFGLQQSVTFGIVSNTRRTLSVGNKTYTNFIQTDAPINPGSSGGPLVNIRGEMIGINTAIYSPTQAFSGIGFASPTDPAKAAFPEFIETAQSNIARAFRRNIPNWARGPALKPAAQLQGGQGLYPWCPPGGRLRQAANTANQPWLGIRASAVNQEIRGFLGLPMARGVLVMEVFDNSPCMAAGLQRGDVIIRVDNRSVKDEAMLEALLSKKKPGDKMKLTVYRDGKKASFNVNLSAALWPKPQGAVLRAQAVALAAQPSAPIGPGLVPSTGLTGVLQGGEVETGAIEALGMELGELSPELALAYGVPEGVRGLIVTESAAQAATAGLLANDVIEAINGQRVESIADFIKAMNKASLRKGISLNVYRQGQRFNLMIKSV